MTATAGQHLVVTKYWCEKYFYWTNLFQIYEGEMRDVLFLDSNFCQAPVLGLASNADPIHGFNF